MRAGKIFQGSVFWAEAHAVHGIQQPEAKSGAEVGVAAPSRHGGAFLEKKNGSTVMVSWKPRIISANRPAA